MENWGGCSSKSPSNNSDASSSRSSAKSAIAIRNSVLSDGNLISCAQRGRGCGRTGRLLGVASSATRAFVLLLLLLVLLLGVAAPADVVEPPAETTACRKLTNSSTSSASCMSATVCVNHS